MTPEHRTARNVALVSVASFVQIVIQFLFQRVLAGWYGASVEADALAAALALPTMFAAIVTGSLCYVLVPELVIKFSPTATSADARDGEPNRAEHAAWQLVSFMDAQILEFGRACLKPSLDLRICSLQCDGLIPQLCPSWTRVRVASAPYLGWHFANIVAYSRLPSA